MKKFKRSFSSIVIKNKNQYILGIGTKQYFVDQDEFDSSLRILDFLREEKTEDDVKSFINDEKRDLKIFQRLLEAKLITSEERLFNKKTLWTSKTDCI